MIVMLVTSDGLSDPRVVRSMRAAGQAGMKLRLVCRAPSTDSLARVSTKAVEVCTVPKAKIGVVYVHRVARLFSRLLWLSAIKRLFRIDRQRPRFWLRPWELWILGGITWFTWQAVMKVRRYPASLYHANDLDTLPAGVLLSRLNKAPLLYDAHELFSAQFVGASRQFCAILFALEHWLIRFAHKVVTVNQSIAETLAAWHAVPVPTVVMNCPFAVEPARVEHGVTGLAPGKTARVIYQGIFVQDRGLEELIQSAAWYDAAELYLRGYGPHEEALRACVRAHGLESRVHFLPPAASHQLVESLVGFDIGVVAYRPTTLNNRFCLPNKVFEYMQAGLALAVSDLPELQRLVKETAAGEVFDPERPRDIARAINFLTADANRLADLKARARAAGRERYTWEAQGEPRLLSCYRELMRVSIPGTEAGRACAP